MTEKSDPAADSAKPDSAKPDSAKPETDQARVVLSRELVLREAVGIADAEGLAALTMRSLATALGAGTMSLYHYVANKNELHNGMVDLVYGEIEAPGVDEEWRAAMRRRSLSARDVLSRHPWAVGLMESLTYPGPENLRHREAVTRCLRRAGFSVEMTVHATWLLDSYVYGFVMQQVSLPFDSAAELAEMADDVFMPQTSAEDFPYLHEVSTTMLSGGYDPASEFTFGLDLILSALDESR